MARQITVRLPQQLDRNLRLAAQKTRRTPSEIVRMALEQFLNRTSEERSPAQRVRGLIGSLESGLPDLAERHREYILESLRGGP